jgi:replication fork clamp-binding protein CrfC
VRLSKALDVDFPFSAYASIENIPVIEVEFVHLAGLENDLGQLTLLDTPGQTKRDSRICTRCLMSNWRARLRYWR